MPTLRDLDVALSEVEEAQTPLDELAALVRLEFLVREVTRDHTIACLERHTQAEVARAVGMSRQAIAKRSRRPKA